MKYKSENNSFSTASKNLINDSVATINKKYKTKIDPEQFTDSVTSNFCTAVLEKDTFGGKTLDTITLIFPVIATTEYAEVNLPIAKGKFQCGSISYNNAFSEEIKRIETICN
mgnify:CR=1 FL=1